MIELKKTYGNFEFVGKAVVKPEAIKINAVSGTGSGWTYNRMDLGVKTKEGNTAYASVQAGFFPPTTGKVTTIRAGLEEDFSTKKEVAFADRNDENIIANISNREFFKVGIEKDSEGKIIVKKFLSPYDAVLYVKEKLEDGTVIKVQGSVSYQIYKGRVSENREIKSIFVSDAEEKDFHANEELEVLVTKNSAIDIDNGLLNCYVVDYAKEIGKHKLTRVGSDGKEYKGKNIPMSITLDIATTDESGNANSEARSTALKKYITSDNDDVMLVGVTCRVINGVETVEIKEEDMPEDYELFKDLINIDDYKATMAVSKRPIKKLEIFKPTLKVRKAVKDGVEESVVTRIRELGVYNGEDFDKAVAEVASMMYADDDDDAVEETQTSNETPVSADSVEDKSWQDLFSI